MSEGEDRTPVIIESYRRMITFKDGLPVVVGRPLITKDYLENMASAALTLPYEPTKKELKSGEGVKYNGLTNGEVIMLKLVKEAANGDSASRKDILDRKLGKAMQTTRSFKVTTSLGDFLSGLSETEKARTQRSLSNAPIDAEVSDVDDL